MKGDDGILGQLWVLPDAQAIATLTAALDAMPALCTADGHHRSAPAPRVVAARQAANPQHTGEERFNSVPSVTFRTHQMRILDYKRVVTDLINGLTEPTFKSRVAQRFAAATSPGAAKPSRPGLLGPVLGIHDLRRDDRIDFIGGMRGFAELEKRVDKGETAAAFAPFPTRMEDLVAIADAGQVPPKSTWFEPKLADGMVSHVLD